MITQRAISICIGLHYIAPAVNVMQCDSMSIYLKITIESFICTKNTSYFYMFCDWNICDIFQTIICQSFCNRSGLEHIYLFVCFFFDAERQIFTVLDRCIQLLCTRFRTNQMLYACCQCLKLWLKPESNITFDRLFVHCLSIMHLSLWLWLKSWLETIFIEMLCWMRWFQGNWCTAQFYFFAINYFINFAVYKFFVRFEYHLNYVQISWLTTFNALILIHKCYALSLIHKCFRR